MSVIVNNSEEQVNTNVCVNICLCVCVRVTITVAAGCGTRSKARGGYGLSDREANWYVRLRSWGFSLLTVSFYHSSYVYGPDFSALYLGILFSVPRSLPALCMVLPRATTDDWLSGWARAGTKFLDYATKNLFR